METINNNPVEVKKMTRLIGKEVMQQYVRVPFWRRMFRRQFRNHIQLSAYAGAVAMWMYVRKTYTIKKKVSNK